MKQIMAALLLISSLATAAPGNISGIGLALDKRGTSYIKVGAVATDSPAAFVPELKQGVVIRAINDGGAWVSLKNTTMEKAVSLIRGEPGSKVSLRISNSDIGPTHDVSLQRQDLAIPKDSE